MPELEARSEPYNPDNLLDRLTPEETLQNHYRLLARREESLIGRHLGVRGGEVLSVGCGWHPGRNLFPAPRFRLTGVDADPMPVAHAQSSGVADAARVGYAGALDFPPESFDVVLYRLVLHHVVYQQPLQPVFDEAARLLRPGGALVAIEPGLWHPVGAVLALANRTGLATAVHGTPDDIPLSPRALAAHAREAGLRPELHAVTYTWRRMPAPVQRALAPLDTLGSRPRTRNFGHTLMLIAHRDGEGARG